MKKLLLLLVTMLIFCTACEWEVLVDETKTDANVSTDVADTENEELDSYVAYSDYQGILSRIKAAQSSCSGVATNGFDDSAVDMVEECEPDAAESNTGTDYSTTNVQVKGIDEGDIVKTDGTYIYILRGDEVILLAATGADTHELSRIAVGGGTENVDNLISSYATALYVYNDTLVILRSLYEYEEDTVNGWGKDYAQVVLVDISDPVHPQKKQVLGQDGYYNTSRLMGNMLYVVSSYAVHSYVEDDIATYIPAVYAGNTVQRLSADDICLCPTPSSRYMVISAIDLEEGEIRSSCSALGAGNLVYMNEDSLYIAGSNYVIEDSAPYTEDVYTVQEHKSYASTQILRYDIAADGSLAYIAGTQVNGYLDSQFSLDAYNGYLRMVVIRDNEQYATYTDEKYGWVNYKWEDDSYTTDNALYILDEKLEMVGSIENLAQDEQIYSARFAGDVVYFCTYRQVDPLFVVDLRNPVQPLVLSTLKISGFSEYLHPFSEHLLFGLGLEVDEESGATEGLKLVMFDISDSTDVFAAHSYVMDESFSSVAMYNHKAILVDAEKNLIGFPTDAGYVIYGYTDQQGFVLRGSVSLQSEDWWSYDSRGLYIEDCFYICSEYGISVLDLAALSELAEITF